MINIPQTHTIKEYKYHLSLIKILQRTVYFSYVGIVGTFIWALLKNTNIKYGVIGIVFIGIIDYFGYKVIRNEQGLNDELAKKIEQRWGIGAVAEFMVQEDLNLLPKEYKILPDFYKKIGGNIDFIIICTKGIFAIEVKSREGVINYSNGKLYSFNWQLHDGGGIEQTMKNATYISDLLETKFHKRYFVQGILEYPRGTIDIKSIHNKIDHIWIGGQRFHEYAIRKSKYHLESKEVEEIYNYLNTLKTQAKKL
ncbi:MAG: nuclease-related domain-containing protein [Microgenomates group bacterium]